MQPHRRRRRAGVTLALVAALALTGCQSLRDDGTDPGAGAPGTGDPDESPVSSDDPPAPGADTSVAPAASAVRIT